MFLFKSSVNFLYKLSFITSSMGVISITQNLDPNTQNIRPWFIVSIYLFITSTFIKLFLKGVDKIFIYLMLWYITSFLSIINIIDFNLSIRRFLLNTGLLIVFLNFSKIYNYKSINDLKNFIILTSSILALYSIVDIYLFKNYNNLFQVIHSLDTLSDGIDNKLSHYFDIPRAKAFFNEANEFSVYLSIPFSFLFTYIFFNKYNKYIIFYILALLIVCLSQIFTLSRAGFFAYFIQFFLIVCIFRINCIRFNNIKLLFFVFSSFCFLSLFISNSLNYFNMIINRFLTTNTSEDWTINERLFTVTEGLNVIFNSTDSLLFGIGLGNLQASAVGSPTTTNFLLDIFVEYGLISSFFYIIFLIKIILSFDILKLNMNYKFYNTITPLKISLFVSIVGMIVQGMTYSINTLVFFWLILGYSLSLNRLSSTIVK